MTDQPDWTMQLGATYNAAGTRFAVWAPKAAQVEVVIEAESGNTANALMPGDDGVHAGIVTGLRPGARYRYRLDGNGLYPDPYSRYQPEGPHGPSELIDPAAFAWTDHDWPGFSSSALVTYELHVGTMTEAGTFQALRRQLPELRRLGVTALELMPLADTPGRWNWGYDGVNLFAPNHNYGRPDDLKRLINAAHQNGLGVIIDVVYNHFGPDGNYLRAFNDDYFTARHQTPWGDGLNYDGVNARFVRDLVIDNACYWLSEYHADGLRLDAIDTIVDDSRPHVLAELSTRVRSATPRPVVLIAEQASNEVGTVHSVGEGGLGMDAVWADDFHHALRVFMTTEREGYFADYHGTPDELVRAIEEGFIYQGEPGVASGWQRGEPVTSEPASAFVFCNENHDQVGNRAFGERLNQIVSAGRYAAASALLLFVPETPLLFMGQEFAASTPFLFFTDHHDELGRLIAAGRREEFKRFPAFTDPAQRERIPNPQAESTFQRSKLRLEERISHRGVYRLYRDLLRLRRDDPVLRTGSRRATRASGVGDRALAVHRWHGAEHRWLITNFADQPLALTPVDTAGMGFDTATARLLLATSWRRYGGDGKEQSLGWRGRGREKRYLVPAESAIVVAT